MLIIDPNFTEPYEFIREENLDEMEGRDYIVEYGDRNWTIEKIVTLKFESNDYESQWVYCREWENPENLMIVDGLSFINGMWPVGRKDLGLVDDFFEKYVEE